MASTEKVRSPAGLLWPFDAYYGWAIAGTALVVSFASSVFYGPVLSVWFEPIREEMGWKAWEVSAAFTIGSFSGSILTAIVGRLMDRYGTRTITAVAGMVVAGAMVGLAFMQTPWQMWIFFGAGRGFAIAGVQLGTTVAIANWFIRKRGRATSFAAFGLRFGQATVPLVAVLIIILLSWRWAYGLLAISGLLLITAPALVYVRRRPEDYGLLPDGDPPPDRAPPNDATGATPAAQRAADHHPRGNVDGGRGPENDGLLARPAHHVRDVLRADRHQPSRRSTLPAARRLIREFGLHRIHVRDDLGDSAPFPGVG